MIIYLLFVVGLAFIPARIASGKGYGYGTFYVFGLFFFLPALIVALVLEDKGEAADREQKMRDEISRLRQEIAAQAKREALDDAKCLIDPLCRQCGHQCEAGAKYCTKCGAQLALIPNPKAACCPKCRVQISAADEFCPSCGWNLTEKEPGAVLVTAVNGQVRCPECGALQKANRTNCYQCGVIFEYQQ